MAEKKKISQEEFDALMEDNASSAGTPESTNYEDSIYNTVISRGHKPELANIIVAQAKHESDNFKSHVFKNSNNPFGMTYAGQHRGHKSGVSQPQKEAGLAYSGYDDVSQATDDVLDWLDRREKEGKLSVRDIDTPEAYAKAIRKSGYYKAPESEYAANLRKYYKQHKAQISQDEFNSLMGDVPPVVEPDPQKKSPVESGLDANLPSSPGGSYETISQPTQNSPAPDGSWSASPAPIVDVQKPMGVSVGVTGQPTKKPEDVSVEIPLSPQQKSQRANEVLAHDYLSTYGVPKGIDISAEGNPINQLTNPHGNPAVSGRYYESRILNLDKDRKIAEQRAKEDEISGAPLSDGATVMQVNDSFEGKKKELKEAVDHTIAQQLFNREYANKKYTDVTAATAKSATSQQEQSDMDAVDAEIAQTKEWAHPKGTEAVDRRRALENKKADIRKRYEQERNKIQEQTKYNPILLGAEKEAMTGNKQAAADLEKLKLGQSIDQRRQYEYNVAGRDIIQSGVSSTVNENVRKEGQEHADYEGDRLFENNKPFIISQAADKIGNKKYEDENDLAHSIIPSAFFPNISEADIRKYGKEEGYDKRVINELVKNPESIPKSASLWQQAGKSLINNSAPIYERGVRSLAAIYGVPSETVEERFKPGWENESGIGAVIAGNMPSAQNSYQNVRGALGQIAGGYAGLVGLTGEIDLASKALGATKLADKAANFGVMAFNGYNSAYQEAKEVIGDKPEDEAKRQLFATAMGLTEASIFSVHSPTKLLGPKTSKAEEILKEIKNSSVNELKDNPELKDKLSSYVMDFGKNIGTQIGLADANKIASNTLSVMFDKKKNHSIGDGLGEESINTALAMLLPSMSGAALNVHKNSPLQAATMFEFGSKPEVYKHEIDKQVSGGSLSPAEGERLKNTLTTMNSVIKNTPTENTEGVSLTPDQIKAYAYSQLQENMLSEQKQRIEETAKNNSIQPDKAQLDPLNKDISELQKQRGGILAQAGEGKDIEFEDVVVPGGIEEKIREEPVENENPERSVATPTEEEKRKTQSEYSNKQYRDFDLNDVRKPSGSIGSQGATPEGANDLLKHIGVDVPFEGEPTLKEMADYLKANPADREKLVNFVKENPIKVTELPDGTFHIEDGHHRATLLYYAGIEEAPAIIKDAGTYNDKYRVINSASEKEKNIPTEAENISEEEVSLNSSNEKDTDQSQLKTEENEQGNASEQVENGRQDSPSEASTENIGPDTKVGGQEDVRESGITPDEMKVTSEASASEVTNEGDAAEAAPPSSVSRKEARKNKKIIVNEPDAESATPVQDQAIQETEEPTPSTVPVTQEEASAQTPVPEESVISAPEKTEEPNPNGESEPAAKEQPQETRLKEIDLELQKQRASQKIEGQKRSATEKAKDVESANKHNDNWHKKQERIEKLEQERNEIEEDERVKARYDNIAERIKGRYENNKAAQKGVAYASILGINPKIADHISDFVVARVYDAIKAGGNLHVAIRRALRHAKEKYGAEAHDIDSPSSFVAIEKYVGDFRKPYLDKEPVLSIEYEEYAKDILADIREGGISLDEARQEVLDQVVENRDGKPMSENIADKYKEKILDYIDWHLDDREGRSNSEKEPQRPSREGKTKIESQDLSETDMASYMGLDTTKDIFGEEGVFDDAQEKKIAVRLDKLTDDARRMTDAYKEDGAPASEWGSEMLSDIKNLKGDTMKQGVAVAGLHIELQAQRVRNEARLRELDSLISKEKNADQKDALTTERSQLIKEHNKMQALIAATQNFAKKLKSTASGVLNTGRLDRMLRNDVMTEYYEKKILSEKQKKERAAWERAERQSIIEDYKKHPQYKADRATLEAEKSKQRATKEVAKEKEGKKPRIVKKVNEKQRKDASAEKQKALDEFPRKANGDRMTPKEFIEFLKEKKKPC